VAFVIMRPQPVYGQSGKQDAAAPSDEVDVAPPGVPNLSR